MTLRLTVGQMLLKLISHYRDDSAKLAKYQRLYLTGAIDPDSIIEICSAILDEKLLKNYELTINEDDISEDPIRRYFETHLAYHTLKSNLDKISIADLQTFLMQIRENILSQGISIPEKAVKTINLVLEGRAEDPSFKRRGNRQYNAFFEQFIKRENLPGFTNEELNKAYYLFATLYFIQVCGWAEIPSPISAYSSNPLFTDKGKKTFSAEEAESIKKTRSQNYGLLKGHMPIFDANDIALASSPFKHWKASDFSKFNDESPTTQLIFQTLVHPYSNGISGVSLLIMKVFANMHANAIQNKFTQNAEGLNIFLKLAYSILLYNSGGHSLFEYIRVLSIPEVTENMLFVKDINFLSLFYNDNQEALQTAVSNTLQYMQRREQKQSIHHELSIFHQRSQKRRAFSKSPNNVGDIEEIEFKLEVDRRC